jgi:thioester reductase-like protein
MTLLMTGGTGFLGLHLLRGHLLAGRRVTLLAHAGSSPALELLT